MLPKKRKNAKILLKSQESAQECYLRVEMDLTGWGKK